MKATQKPTGVVVELTREGDETGEVDVGVDPYRELFEHAAEGLFQATPAGALLRANAALARVLGYRSPRELIDSVGEKAREIYVDPTRRDELMRQLEEQGAVTNFESQILRRDGKAIWVSENVRAIRAGTAITHLQGSMVEVTERKAASEILRESEERLHLAYRGSNDGIWDWNLKTGSVHFCDRWKDMIGLAPETTLAPVLDEWFTRVHADDLPRLKAEVEGHLEGSTPAFENEHRIRHADGTYRWMLSRGLAVRDSLGRAVRMAGAQTDISKRKIAEEQILHSAFHDALTGLPNRSLLMDRLARSIWRTKRQDDHLFALLFLDLDRFKVINDSLGHMAGDRLLIAISRRLEKCLRAVDSIARIGGDEFAILLEDLERGEDATRVAQRIEQALKQPFHASGQEVFTSVSVGIALSSTAYDRPEDVLRDADTAMFRAKNLGRQRFEVFDRAMHDQALTRLRLETDLRRAVEAEQFFLTYQPIVDLKAGHIVGFEALIRWKHPEKGMISPLTFIPLAEEMGLIVPIGQWVIHEACRQMAAWNESCGAKAPSYVSVNLSGRQFAQPNLVGSIKQALDASGLHPSRLRVELTESVLMDKAEATAAVLNALRDMGMKIAVDDFGTGYSSLSYLQRFPVNTLKIDKSFTDRVNTDGAPMIEAIISLAHGLGMDIVAEGVEHKDQAARLLKMSCEYGQGYVYAKPMEGPAAEALLKSDPRF